LTEPDLKNKQNKRGGKCHEVNYVTKPRARAVEQTQ